MTALQLADALKQGASGPGILLKKIGIDRIIIRCDFHEARSVDSPDFRCENQRPVCPFGDIERLDTQPITPQHQAPLATVPYSKREHAVETRQDFFAPGLIAMYQHFGVGMVRGKDMTQRLKLSSNCPVVVNLSVKNDPDRAILIGHRLVAGVQVHNR